MLHSINATIIFLADTAITTHKFLNSFLRSTIGFLRVADLPMSKKIGRTASRTKCRFNPIDN